MNLSKRPGWFLLGIFLIAIAVRVGFSTLPRVPHWDEASYLAISRNLLVGNGYRELSHGFDVHQPPMITLLASLGWMLHLPIAYVAAVPVFIGVGSFIVFPLYALGKSFYNPQVGLLAAFIGAIHPALAVKPLYWGSMTEVPFTLAVLCGIFCTYQWGTALSNQAHGVRIWRWPLATGLAFGLGFLARPEALVFMAAMLMYVFLVGIVRKPRCIGRVLLTTSLAMGVLILTMLPYLIYLHGATGHWVLSGKAGTSMDIAWAFATNNQALHDQAGASLDSTGQEMMWLSPEVFNHSITDWIKANPERFLQLIRINIRDTWRVLFSPALVSLLFASLIALGLFHTPWKNAQLKAQLALIFAMLPLASLWIVFIEERFVVVYFAISLIWAAAGLARLLHWLHATQGLVSRARVSKVLQFLALLALFFLLGLGAVRTAQAERAKEPFQHEEAGLWLAANTPANSAIMTRQTEVVVYANRAMVGFPNASWEKVLDYAWAHGATYLVVDKWEIQQVRPHLQSLVDPLTSYPLSKIKLAQVFSYKSKTTYVYQFIP